MGRVECEIVEPEQARVAFRCVKATFGYPVSVTKPMLLTVVAAPAGKRSGCNLRITDVPKRWRQRGKHARPFALLVDRGKCFFHEKALAAQRAGASAVIVANTDRRGAQLMSTPSTVLTRGCCQLGHPPLRHLPSRRSVVNAHLTDPARTKRNGCQDTCTHGVLARWLLVARRYA